MSDLKNHYQSILAELDNHFQDKEEKAFVLNKFQELSMMFMDVIDRLTFLTDIRAVSYTHLTLPTTSRV